MADQHNNANPATPETPAALAAPAAPGGPPVPPKRGGLPGWAWALIGGGALVLIAMIVVAVIVVNSVLGAIADDRAAPAVTATPSTSETASPTEPPAGGSAPAEWEEGIFSLDDQVDLGGAFPVWGYLSQDGWETTLFDQQGLNQSENSELGCQFTSGQSIQRAYDVSATDDLTDTLATVDALQQQLLDGNNATVVGDFGYTDFGVNLSDAAERIEFLTTRIDYEDPDEGVSYTNEIAARVMPVSEAFLYIVVRCPTSLVEDGDSPFEDLRADLAVIIGGPGSVGPE